MNCNTCIKGYNITDDTKSCYDYLPEQYYLDNDTLKKCYKRCSRCFIGSNDSENMNCLSCISNVYFYRKDTFNCILRNETPITDVVEIKPSTFLYMLFVFIILFSIIISAIFLSSYLYPENNQRNDYIKITEDKANEIKVEKVEIQGENLDINTQIKEPVSGIEFSLVDERSSKIN